MVEENQTKCMINCSLPKIDGADENLKKVYYDTAHKTYGNPLPANC